VKPITRNRHGPSSDSYPKGNRGGGLIEVLHNSRQNLLPKERHLNGRTFFQFTSRVFPIALVPAMVETETMPQAWKRFCAILATRKSKPADAFACSRVVVISNAPMNNAVARNRSEPRHHLCGFTDRLLCTKQSRPIEIVALWLRIAGVEDN
jgi:hypothetical protein